MISYAELERIYRLERDSPTLQNIPAAFYSETLQLIENPEIKEQKNNLTQLLNDIYERRRTKITLQALRTKSNEKTPENATPQEQQFYKSLTAILAESRENTFRPAIAKPQKQAVDVNKIKVKILRPLPAIVASDLNEYGPYNGTETTELPEENAKILITQGIAEEVK